MKDNLSNLLKKWKKKKEQYKEARTFYNILQDVSIVI